MLVVIQVHARSSSEILLQVLGPRLLHAVYEETKDLLDEYATLIRDTISKHLLSIGLTHRVTIYSTNHEPRLLFLQLMEEFPPELISTLVSLLASQEVTPPLLPPEPFPLLSDW